MNLDVLLGVMSGIWDMKGCGICNDRDEEHTPPTKRVKDYM